MADTNNNNDDDNDVLVQQAERVIRAEREKQLGNNLFSDGEYEESIEHYNRAIELVGDRSTYFFNRATAFHRLWLSKLNDPTPPNSEHLEKALLDLNRAIALEPSYGKAIFRKAEVQFALGEWNSSFTAFQHALLFLDAEKMRLDAEIYAQIISEHTLVPEYYSLETRRDPRVLANIEKKIGNEYYRKSSYDVAIEHYSRALKYYSNDAVVYTNLAAASLEHAKEFTKRTDEAASGMEMAIAGLARLRQLYIKRALDAATKATELDPTYAKAFWRKGQVLLDMKRYQQAVDALERAKQLSPDSPIILADYVKAKKLNDNSLARKTHKLIEYESIRTPKRCDVWKVAKSESLKQKLGHPRIQEALRDISETPSSLKKYMADPSVKQVLVELMKEIEG